MEDGIKATQSDEAARMYKMSQFAFIHERDLFHMCIIFWLLFSCTFLYCELLTHRSLSFKLTPT